MNSKYIWKKLHILISPDNAKRLTHHILTNPRPSRQITTFFNGWAGDNIRRKRYILKRDKIINILRFAWHMATIPALCTNANKEVRRTSTTFHKNRISTIYRRETYALQNIPNCYFQFEVKCNEEDRLLKMVGSKSKIVIGLPKYGNTVKRTLFCSLKKHMIPYWSRRVHLSRENFTKR